MKTKEKVLKNGMAETLDEVIFANRNHAYGAFELRRKYNKHLLVGFIFGFFVFATGISVPLIQSLFGDEAFRKPPETDVNVTFTDLPDQKIELPKPPDIPLETKANVFRIQVVDSVLPGEDALMTNEELLDSADNTYTTLTYVPEDKNRGKIFDDPDEREGQVFVEENATFQGGDIGTFVNWLQSNLNYPAAAVAAEIEGKVFVEFAVNTKGYVCDAHIVRGLHPSINDECIRVLMSSPKWTPAKQNGNLIKQKLCVPVVFKINR